MFLVGYPISEMFLMGYPTSEMFLIGTLLSVNNNAKRCVLRRAGTNSESRPRTHLAKFSSKARSAAAGATAMGAGHAGQRRGVGSLPTADSMARVLRGLVALACVVATTSFNPFLGGVARTRRLRGAPAGVQTRKTSVRIPLRLLDESSADVR